MAEGNQTIAVGDGLVDGSGDCADIERVKQDCGVARSLGERADLRGGDGCACSECLQHGDARPLMQRRDGDGGRMLVQAP